MAKTSNLILIAALFVTAIPLISGQLAAPASAPMFPGGGGFPAAGPTSFDPMVGAPSPGPDCTTYLFNLTDCLTFVSIGSNLTIPDPGCCSALSNLVANHPICLCELIGNPDQTGFSIDTTKALQLPSVCNVTTPPVSLCAVAGVPVSLPPGQSQAPLASSPGSGSGSGGGSVAASPSPGSGINRDINGSNDQFTLTLSLNLIGLAAATLFIYSHI